MSNKHDVAILAQIAHFVRIRSATGGDNEAAARGCLLTNSFGTWRNEAVWEQDNLPLCPMEACVDNVASPEVGVLDFGVGEIRSVQAGALERFRAHNIAMCKVGKSKIGLGEITVLNERTFRIHFFKICAREITSHQTHGAIVNGFLPVDFNVIRTKDCLAQVTALEVAVRKSLEFMDVILSFTRECGQEEAFKDGM